MPTGVTLKQGEKQYDTNTGQYIGTTEYDAATGRRLQRGGTTILPPADAPNSADRVNPVRNLYIPNNSIQTGNISDASATSAGAQKFIDTSMQAADEEAARVAKQQEALAKSDKSFLDKILSAPSPADTRKSAQKETGINPKNYFADQQARIKEIDSLTADYNKEVAKRDALIAKVQENSAGGFEAALDSRVAKIKNDAAIQLNQMSANINSKAATLQALQGNFNSAQNFVNQAVQDATAEQRYNMDLYNTVHNRNKDIFDALDEPYKKAFEAKLDLVQKEYQQSVADKTAVGNLMVNNPQAGISISDTLTEAYQKVGFNPATNSQIIGSADTGYFNVITDNSGRVISQKPVLAGGTGGTTEGFSSAKIESSVREDAVDLLDDVVAGVTTLDAVYTKLRRLYSRSEVTDQALKDLLGITPLPEAITNTTPQARPHVGNFGSPRLNTFINKISDFLFGEHPGQ